MNKVSRHPHHGFRRSWVCYDCNWTRFVLTLGLVLGWIARG